MTGTNHIAGGIVITGLFASFHDINIFENVAYISTTIGCCLLPDIDHRKSIMGKMFHPIAVYLDQHFGHRTITHSFLFLGIIIALVAFIEHLLSNSFVFTTITLFALLSHYILDMITVQGIPLLYPFKRNPCVIPGDPKYRLRNTNFKNEVAGFIIFIMLGFSLLPLYQNGFWTSYNRAFGTILHVHRENRSSKTFIKCQYSYFKNSTKHTGLGYVIQSKEEALKIFDRQKDQLITLNSSDKYISIEHTKPVPTNIPKQFNEVSFFSIKLDSLKQILHNRIVTGTIQSSQKIKLIKNNIVKNTKLIKLDNAYNYQIHAIQDTNNSAIVDKFQQKKIRLKQQKQEYQEKRKELKQLKQKKQALKQKIQATQDIYTKNKYQKQYLELTDKIESFNLQEYKPDPMLIHQMTILKDQLNQKNPIKFSGFITYPVIP